MLVEEAVLSTILKEPHLLSDVELKPEYFQSMENRSLFLNMKQLASQGKHIDMITLITAGDVESFGGAGKLNRIAPQANAGKFDNYVNLMIEQWQEREKLNVLEIAKLENWSLERITKELNDLVSTKVDDFHDINDLLVEVYESPWEESEVQTGIDTGLKSLQLATNGWQNGDLVIVAARPSMGKTDVMLHLARHAGWNDCIPIVFSLEMPGKKLRDRLIASVGSYNRSKMKDVFRRLTEKQKDTWSDTLGMVSKTSIKIFDKSGQTVPEMRMKVRKVKNENPGKQLIVFIDYLTLIKPMDDYRGNMHLATSDISKGLKAMAKEFDCPVISLAQLSRGVEKRDNKRPILSDLRESGSIEEDADLVMFLYRDAYYSKNEEDNSLELIIAKNREGEVGTINATYNKFTGVINDI